MRAAVDRTHVEEQQRKLVEAMERQRAEKLAAAAVKAQAIWRGRRVRRDTAATGTVSNGASVTVG